MKYDAEVDSILNVEESEVTKFIIKQTGSYLLEKFDIEERAKIFYMLKGLLK